MKRRMASFVLAISLLTAMPALAASLVGPEADGQVVYYNDIPHYVDAYGTTSVFVEGPDVIWLKEEAKGQTAWIGLDNRSQTFDEGSRFHVQWLNEQDKAWERSYGKLDADVTSVPLDHLWMFELGVTTPDGEEVSELNDSVSLYIQIGEDWEPDDLHACYIAEGTDEKLIVDVMQLDEAGITGTFGKVSLKHFSPYAIYDIGEVVSLPPKTGDYSEVFLWTALACMSFIGMFMIAIQKKKA